LNKIQIFEDVSYLINFFLFNTIYIKSKKSKSALCKKIYSIMKYIKKYNEEVSVKKALLGGAIAATLAATSCKKEDIIPNEPEKTTVDSTKVDDKVDKVDDSEKKPNLYNFIDAVDKISSKKEEPVKVKPKKTRKINKFKDFIKSKFKKS